MRLPLKLVLVVPFLLQIFAAVGLIGYLSYRNSKQSINNLVNQLQERSSQQVAEHLDAYLNTPQSVIRLMSDAVELGSINLQNKPATLKYLWHLTKIFPAVSYFNYGLDNADFIGIGRAYNLDAKLFIEETSLKHINFLYQYEVKGNGDQGKFVRTKPFGDFRKDVWYSQPKIANQSIWTDIYNWVDDPEVMVVSAGRPIYREGKFLGVAGVDLLLSNIGQYLKLLKISPSSEVFIIERNGLLVASSSDQLPFNLIKGEAVRIPVTEAKNSLISSSAKFLKLKFGDFSKIQSPETLIFVKNRKRQFIRVLPWRDRYGLNWLIAVIIPESDFVHQLDINNRITLILCLIAFVMTLAVGILTARWITNPVITLNQSAIAITKGDYHQIKYSTFIEELYLLTQAFNEMSKQVNQSFIALEEVNNNLEHRVEERTQKLKETLEDLQQTERQLLLQEKMSSLGRLVSGIAHEINNPVTFIQGNIGHLIEYIQEYRHLIKLYQENCPEPNVELEAYLEEIDLEFLEEDIKNIFNSMNNGTSRITEIVKSLRTFSRLDEVGIKPTNLQVEIENILSILQHLFLAQHSRSAIKLIRDFEPLPLVECDPGDINQVLINLMTNAIDALEQKYQQDKNYQGWISIRTKICANNQIEIAIMDNGGGINLEIQDKIFDPFFTTKDIGKGTGMGLAITYQLVTEKHRGQLIFSSNPGTTTEFILRLPIYQSR